MHDLLYYRRSGRMGALGLPWMLGMGLGAGALLGIPYAYAVHYCPLIYINFLITLGFAAVIGAAVSVGARRGKVRNLGMVLLAGLIAGAGADYVAWVGYAHAVMEDPVWPWDPSELWSCIQAINAQGVWSIKHATPTGYTLAAVWVVEAGILSGMAMYVPRAAISTTPFNEQSGTWADQVATYGPFQLKGEEHTLTSRLEAGDVAAIDEFLPAPAIAISFHQCLVTTCADDDQFILLSVEALMRATDKDGKPEVRNRSVVRHLFITPAMRKAIEAKAAEPVVAPAAPGAAAPPAADKAQEQVT